MHVLYLVPDLFGPGGIARHGRVLCQALLEAGVTLDVLALNDSSTPRAKDSQALLGFAGLNYRGCDGHRPTFVRVALQRARRRPVVVLVEHANFSPLGWMAARVAGARWAVVAHGVEVWQPLSRLRGRSLRLADQVICVSHFTARRIVQSNRVAPTKTRVLHNCLDPQLKFQNARGPQEGLSLLTVGRTTLEERYKGHDRVIRALPQLLGRFPGLTYHIVGDGSGRPELQELAKQQGVDGSLRWSAGLSDEELARCYAQTSLFIMPSQYEGFGLVFVEAMAQGVPVIGGNSDATPEVIADGETGFVVDPLSIEEIVDKTSRLLDDAALRERMGRAGIERVGREFSFGKFQGTLLSHLKELGLRVPEAPDVAAPVSN